MQSLKGKVHYSLSSKGCEFQKPEQVTEMGEQGRVEAVISSAVAVGWHYKDCFCQGKRWKYSLSVSIFCTLKKSEVHNGIPKCLKAIHFSIALSLEVTLGIMRLFLNNMLFPLQQDIFFSSWENAWNPDQIPCENFSPSYTFWVFYYRGHPILGIFKHHRRPESLWTLSYENTVIFL